jgi:hypothetical protein
LFPLGALAQQLLDAPGPGYESQRQRAAVYRHDLLDALPRVRLTEAARGARDESLLRDLADSLQFFQRETANDLSLQQLGEPQAFQLTEPFKLMIHSSAESLR